MLTVGIITGCNSQETSNEPQETLEQSEDLEPVNHMEETIEEEEAYNIETMFKMMIEEMEAEIKDNLADCEGDPKLIEELEEEVPVAIAELRETAEEEEERIAKLFE